MNARLARDTEALPDERLTAALLSSGWSGQFDAEAARQKTLSAQSDVAALLALSDERDRQIALRLQAWRDGYAAAVAHLGEQYEVGWVNGLLARKRIQHAIVEAAKLEMVRWGGLRARFGDPRPGDYEGQRVRSA